MGLWQYLKGNDALQMSFLSNAFIKYYDYWPFDVFSKLCINVVIGNFYKLKFFYHACVSDSLSLRPIVGVNFFFYEHGMYIINYYYYYIKGLAKKKLIIIYKKLQKELSCLFQKETTIFICTFLFDWQITNLHS